MLSVSKPASLVQQKKQQWAREREEMSHLYLPWGTGERYTNRLQVRNQFASTLELHKQSSYEYQEPLQRQRSPSLPPIHHIEERTIKDERKTNIINRNIPSAKRFAFYDEDGEGDTSGYGSETLNHMNRSHRPLHDVSNRSPVVAWQQEEKLDRMCEANSAMSDSAWSRRSPRSGEEGRLRWGDRGVATGHLWEPTAPNARLPQMPNQKKGTPSWIERGLNMIDNKSEVLVIDQRSVTNSVAIDCDRSSCSDESRTFLRGQNVPLEPEIKAQRENKRMKALELQSAILSQLEDREKRRQEERERQLREEKLEELRIQRQQQEDRQRIEEERQKLEDKQLMEQKKLDTLKKALDDAERKAKLDKEKRFTYQKRMSNVNDDNKSKNEDNLPSEPTSEIGEPGSPTKTSRTYDVHSAQSQKRDCNSHQTTEFNSPRSAGPSNLNLFIHNIPPLTMTDSQVNIVPITTNSSGELINPNSNNIQLAVLVPQSVANNMYSVALAKFNNDISEIEKLLTPNKYRSLQTKDATTQTDPMYKTTATSQKLTETDELERNIDKDYPKIDENAPQDSHHILKKERRFRSEERFKKDLENRPKWGVNRPAAQYKKQSEKDPFYSQKRKMRQKFRQQRYSSHSSDDSRSPSPPINTEKIENVIKPRNSLSQSYWRSKREVSKSNYNSDIILTDTNSYTQTSIDSTENKKSPKISINRVTLTQKFINDKYGNRKLWTDDSKSNIFDVENRKTIIDQINIAKRDYLGKHEDHDIMLLRTKSIDSTLAVSMLAQSWINTNKIRFAVLYSKLIIKNMSKIDDIFDKKKDEAPMLDLSKTVINTAEEYRAVLDKVPDFKTRPEKVRAEDVKIKDRPEDNKTKTSRKEIRAYETLGTRGYEEKHFTFMDPIPVEMRGLKFEELCTVPIEWRMLTSIRPKSKLDEEYFNRLIELRKSEIKTQARDKREYAKNPMLRKTKTRSGVTETRIVSCFECGEEYCNGKMCAITNYDMFTRLKIEVEAKTSKQAAAPTLGASKTRRLRRRAKRKPRSKSAAPAVTKQQRKSGAKSDSEL